MLPLFSRPVLYASFSLVANKISHICVFEKFESSFISLAFVEPLHCTTDHG